MGFSPRKRAESLVPHFSSWPETADGPRLQSFAGYKAGMTHAVVVDYRKTSTTSGQEVAIPVTIIETPPMRVVAVRVYSRGTSGLKCLGEVWATNLDKDLGRAFPIPEKKHGGLPADMAPVEEVRVVTTTQPRLTRTGGKKTPEIMETRIGGGTVDNRVAFAKTLLGKEIKITDFAREGAMVDIAAITAGQGWQGATKRWGIKLLRHKNSKHRRGTGTLGSFNPGYVRPTVPQGGQRGYHQRTEYNKRILKIGEDGKEVTPQGGFLHYGNVRAQYVVLHGSIPGPTKRLIRFRDPARLVGTVLEEPPQLTYISTQSKQGT